MFFSPHTLVILAGSQVRHFVGGGVELPMFELNLIHHYGSFSELICVI